MNSLLLFGFAAILVYVPLPIGSVGEGATFAFEAATIVLFLAYWGWRLAVGGKREENCLLDGPLKSAPDPTGYPVRFPPVVRWLLGGFLVISIVQLIPLPLSIIRALSPRTAAIYASLARDGVPGWEARRVWTLSLSPSKTAGELLLLVCIGIFAFLVVRVVRSRRQVTVLVLAMLGSALFQAFYGMAAAFGGSTTILGTHRRLDLVSATGTYVNRNHYAGLLEMLFPLALGWLLVKARFFAMERGWSLRRRILWFSQESLQWTFLYGLAAALIGLGIVFSRSRSGITVFLATLLLAVAALGFRGSGDEEAADAARRLRFRRMARLVFVGVAGAAVWLGVGPVVERFAKLDLARDARRTFAENTLAIVSDFPLAGTGKGTFVDAYGMYERVDDRTKLSFAHDDYLDAAAENGIPAAACLGAAAIALVAALAVKWRRRRSGFAQGIGLGALLGMTALLLHSFTDFNFQVPANAIYFAALCGIAESVLRKPREIDYGRFARAAEEGARTRAAGVMRLKGAAALVGAVALLAFATTQYLGFHQLGRYQKARRQVPSIQRGFAVLEPLALGATRLSGRPEIRRERARLYLEMAVAENSSGRDEARDEMCGRAIDAYGEALAANPLDATAWYERGLAYALLNHPLLTHAGAARADFERALRFKPADRFLHLNSLLFDAMWWGSLGPEERDAAAGRLRRMEAEDKTFVRQLRAAWTRNFPDTARLDAVLMEISESSSK